MSLPIAARLKPAQNIPHDTEETEAAKALRLAIGKAIGNPLRKGAFTQRSVPESLRSRVKIT